MREIDGIKVSIHYTNTLRQKSGFQRIFSKSFVKLIKHKANWKVQIDVIIIEKDNWQKFWIVFQRQNLTKRFLKNDETRSTFYRHKMKVKFSDKNLIDFALNHSEYFPQGLVCRFHSRFTSLKYGCVRFCQIFSTKIIFRTSTHL